MSGHVREMMSACPSNYPTMDGCFEKEVEIFELLCDV